MIVQEEVSTPEPVVLNIDPIVCMAAKATVHLSVSPLPDPPDDPKEQTEDMGEWLRWSLLASEVLKYLDESGILFWRKKPAYALTH